MSLENEKEIYDKASVSSKSGEIEVFDKNIYPEIIRKRELKIIYDFLDSTITQDILELGCGGGWLTKKIASKGFRIVGIDSSKNLIDTAKSSIIQNCEYRVADAMNLPFKDNCFDLVIGIGVLHHLDLTESLDECKRVLRFNGNILFLEPNNLNLLANIGRNFFPMEIHTEDEIPLNKRKIKKTLESQGFVVEPIKSIFPYSFAISYLVGKKGYEINQRSISLIKKSEIILEKCPIFAQMGWALVIKARKSGD